MAAIKPKEAVDHLVELDYLDVPSRHELILMKYLLRHYFTNPDLRSSPQAARVFEFTLGYISNWVVTLVDVPPALGSVASLNHFLKAAEKVIKRIKKFYMWLKKHNGFDDPHLIELMALFERLLFPTPDVGFWHGVRSDAWDYLRLQLGSSHASAFRKQLLADFKRDIATDFDFVSAVFQHDTNVPPKTLEAYRQSRESDIRGGGLMHSRQQSFKRKLLKLITRI